MFTEKVIRLITDWGVRSISPDPLSFAKLVMTSSAHTIYAEDARFASSSGTQGQLVGTKGFSWAKVYYNRATSPWALTLTELVPEAFEFPAFDWPEKYFSGQSEKRTSRCLLTRSCFPHRSPQLRGPFKGGILDEIFTKIQRSRANRKLSMAAGKHQENFHSGLIEGIVKCYG